MIAARDKLLIVGWDGATFDVIQPMVARGELPHLSSVMAEGVHGLLCSTVPLSSAVAWSTFMTGRNPWGHGIFGFYQTNGRSYRPHLISSRDLQAPCLWDWLGRAGLRTGVINMPLTYPPRPLHGFLVSGMLTPGPKEIFTYPPDLASQLLASLPVYPIEAQIMRQLRKTRSSNAILDLLHHWTTDFHANVCRLLTDQSWDTFIVVYRATDLVQHFLGFLWHPELAPDRRVSGVEVTDGIEAVYRQVDNCLGELLARVSPATNVLILSDHGAGPTLGRFYMNNWLCRHGYLALRSGIRYRRWLNRGRCVPLHRGLNRLGLSLLARHLPSRLADWSISLPDRHQIYHLVNWHQTRAYVPFSGNQDAAIRLNLAGREPHGIVQPGGEAKALLSELAYHLATLCDPQGELLFREVMVSTENSTELIANQGPDLVALPREENHHTVLSSIAPDTLMFAGPPYLVGQHRMHGIFAARGPAVAPGVTLYGARLVDVAPTLLHLMGVPVPVEMDGQVLAAALRREWLAAHPVQMTVEHCSEWRSGQLRVYSPKEATQIKDTLCAMGYLE